MSKLRIKVKLPEIQNRADAEQCMNFIASAANAKRMINAELDQKILDLKKQYDVDLSSFDEEMDLQTRMLQVWAEANPAEFPKGRKSIEFLSGTLGFRTGTPKLALLNRKWNWDSALAAVQSYLPNFIRNKPEIDKEAIVNQRNDDLMPESIQKCGMKVVQDESFYIEPKLTE
jgi:phage host-nuclease inhibitor protein Gam